MAPRVDDENVDVRNAAAEGLAKGVFVYRKRKRNENSEKSTSRRSNKSKRRRKSGKQDPPMTHSRSGDDINYCSLALLENEFADRDPQWSSERVIVHNELLEQVDARVETIQTKMFEGVHESLVTFVKNSQKLRENSVRTIPTAVLLTGVNMPDHSRVVDLLVKRLKSITAHISLIQPGQSMKQLVTNLVLDLVNPTDDDNDEEDEVSVIKKSEACFSYLQQWYNNQYSEHDTPPLVILVQDFENFTGSCLSDLITLCSRYQDTLPFVFILGVATTVAAVHRTLPYSVTSHLTINTFGSPNSSLHLEEVIESIIIDPEIPFKLSDKVLKFLLDVFLYYDFSVNRFLSAYRFLVGEHLFRQPAGMLLCGEQEAVEKVQLMDMDQLSYICRVPSFKAYVEKLKIEEQAELLTNIKLCKQTITTLVQEYFEYVRTFTCMVKVLFTLTKELPRRSLGRHLRDVYFLALAGAIHSTSEYREAFQFLKLTNRFELENKLNFIQKEISDRPELSEFGEKIRITLEKLDEIKNLPDSVAGSPSVTERFNISSALSTPFMTPSLSNTGITPLHPSEDSSPAMVSSSSTPSERTTRTSSPAKKSTPVQERSTRNSPMKSGITPVHRSTRNSPMKASTPLDTPVIQSTSTPADSGSNTPVESTSNTPAPSTSSIVGSPYPGKAVGGLDRLKLGKKLLENVQRNSILQQNRPFDRVRSEFMADLNIYLTKFLEPPTSRPLHEIFMFTSIGVVRNHLTGAPRASLHAALTDPYLYLRNDDMKIADPGEIPASLPDLSIAYKLHLECPRLINIFDWLSCWHSIVTAGQEGGITKLDQARFTRCVSELQHLGFIKTSTRKTDHVARLTFGGS